MNETTETVANLDDLAPGRRPAAAFRLETGLFQGEILPGEALAPGLESE